MTRGAGVATRAVLAIRAAARMRPTGNRLVAAATGLPGVLARV